MVRRASGGGRTLPVRYALEGGDQFIRDSNQLATRGQQSLGKLATAARPASLGLRAIERGASELRGEMELLGTRVGTVGTVLSGLGPAGLAAAATIGGIVIAARELKQATGETIEELSNLKAEAQTALVGVETYQELSAAAKELAVDQGALTDGLKELTLRADEFATRGAGPAVEAFERLGFSQEEVNERLRAGDDLFLDVIGKIEDLDEAAQALTLDELFGGTAGEQFQRFLEVGADGIRELAQEARRLGIVLDEQLIEKADEVNDQLNTLQQIIDANVARSLVDLGPILVDLAEFWADLAEAIADVVDGFRDLEDRSTRGLKEQLAETGAEALILEERLRALQESSSQLDQARIEPLERQLAVLDQQRERILEILQLRKEQDDRDRDRPGGGAGGGAEVIARQASQLEAVVQGLQDAATLERVANEERSTAVALLRAQAAAQADYAAGLRDNVILTGEEVAQIRLLVNEAEQLAEARERATAESEEASRIIDSLRTSEERLIETQTRLRDLFESGAVDDVEAYEEAMARLQTQIDDTGEEVVDLNEVVRFGSRAALQGSIGEWDTWLNFVRGIIDSAINKWLSFLRLPGLGGNTGIGGGGFDLFGLFGGGGSGGGGGLVGTIPGPTFTNKGAVVQRATPSFAGSGRMIDRPTQFLTAGGVVTAGEAGKEAIFPLETSATGELGIKATGGGGPAIGAVIINDMRGAEAPPVETERSVGSDGQEEIRLFIRDAVQADLENGGLDAQLESNFGTARNFVDR